MKKTIITLLIFCSTVPAFSTAITDSVECLKQLSEKEFISRLDHYCHVISTEKSVLLFNDSNFVEIVMLINTIDAYLKQRSFSNYIDTFKLIMPELNKSLHFIRIPGDGSFCEKHNLFTGGYARASSIYWITDWIYPPGLPDIVDNCECSFPPCD